MTFRYKLSTLILQEKMPVFRQILLKYSGSSNKLVSKLLMTFRHILKYSERSHSQKISSLDFSEKAERNRSNIR